ncbi:NmrA family transcriptional regulator [Mycolicibacterium peregrinum]|uniref:SDR family oxidoreductase n=1 Tax=Mycolicibacterium peregrinum TaxID=43304 RepID=UPI0006D7C799|nr:NAD(P)H-binding protein [Mycolicibacterium peregrinum]MCV7203960.1 NAD(P)H-binding protein [Mycolicibacterium peregrinum]ORW50521.1 NmrA family transcriptional regulator [Mycolicibacterium peregrinum]OWM03940.1 NmrA family transcriptional regulator [Mycolicibacterium peregrinum]
MRIAVAGATGNIGARVVVALQGAGHDVVAISRSNGVDLSTGDGLDAALAGVQAVVDAISAPPADRDSTVDYLGTATRNLLAAEARAGVAHHVLLSIVGIHDIEGNPHYAGKREQERLIEAGSVPWTIVPATQFHDFAETVVSWTEQNGRAEIAPLLVQPIDPDDVAAVLAEVVVGDPQGRHVDVAGPQTQDLVDLARRTLAARGREVTLVPTWSSIFGLSMSGNALLPAENARIAPTTFDQWLSRQR